MWCECLLVLRRVIKVHTIARSLLLLDVSKTQDDEVGDGTTSVCVLSGELLREAEKLLQQSIHPQTIIQGFRLAEKVAQKALAVCNLR